MVAHIQMHAHGHAYTCTHIDSRLVYGCTHTDACTHADTHTCTHIRVQVKRLEAALEHMIKEKGELHEVR